MTEATYIAVSEKQYELKGKRRFSVSGVLNETIGRFKIQLLCIAKEASFQPAETRR